MALGSALDGYIYTRSLIPSFGACTRSCFVPRYRSVVCTDACPRSNWICSSSPPAARHIFAHERRRSWGAIPGTPAAAAYPWSNCQTTFSLRPPACAWPARFTGRNTYPSVTPATDVHASIATFTHVGIGTVRTRPCFPTRSTMHHRPSRCWTWGTVSAATSDRRSPQPRSTARIARSRRPLVAVASGAFNSVCACRTVSQFPKRTPLDATPFTRVIPLASSGASSPLSAASTARLRTAVIRTLRETAPSPRASRATRHAHTVAFVNPGRGSCPYHSKNSSSPRLYTRRVIGDETLSSTNPFHLRQSVGRGTSIKSVI